MITAEQYHHIEEVTEAWHRRLDRDNVIGLSEANHRRIHKEYDRGYMAKKKMQRTLYDMLQRFRREFGDSGGYKNFLFLFKSPEFKLILKKTPIFCIGGVSEKAAAWRMKKKRQKKQAETLPEVVK